MEILTIFTTKSQGLFSVVYGETDIFTELLESWHDTAFLFDFFTNNKPDLDSYFHCSVKDAVIQTQKDARMIEKLLFSISKEIKNSKHLDSVFKPLDHLKLRDLERYKMYGVLENTWLRLYAIKVDEGHYVITGGAIKLTRTMQDRLHTKNELARLDRCRSFLITEGIIDSKSITELSKEK